MEHETPMEHEMLPGAPVFDGAAPVAASLFGGAGTAAVLQGGIELPVELGVQPGLDSGSLSVSPLASMLGTPELNMLAEAASSGLPPSQGFVLPESRPEPPAGGILAGLFEGGPITVAPFKHVAQQAATISRGARVFESLIVHRAVVERATMGTDHGGGYLAAASARIKACPPAGDVGHWRAAAHHALQPALPAAEPLRNDQQSAGCTDRPLARAGRFLRLR